MTDQKIPAMMTVAQVAELFEVDVTAVHDWLAAGKFPGAYKISDKRTAPYLIPTEEVEAYKKARSQSKD
jgi:hypothetical protein